MPDSVIRYAGLAGAAVFGDDVPDGSFLKSFDPEAGGGMGYAEWTTDPQKAMRFEDGMVAMRYWMQQSQKRPWRPDGQPNRPLTAFSVTIERLP